MAKYDHKKIEKKWQKKWAAGKIYKTEDGERQKCYVLDMFPYPSGEGLHVGHPKGYIATDIYSRFKRMSGFEVLHPMGWDAFGLPAENYAIKNKTHPRKAVEKNIKRYKEQLSIIGFDYDWSREINTTDPAYYKWTQWIFLKLYERGLAYESHEPINWCPSCQTGLANEDLEAGKCERCGSVVEKRPMRQWVLKITDYAERLLADLPPLNWPEHIKESQRNWIGKSEGAEIDFAVKFAAGNSAAPTGEKITVFTSRPETIFGATYLVLAPEHELVAKFLPTLPAENKKAVEKYLAETKSKTEIDRTTENKDKTGVKLEGVTAINPANDEEIPVFIADYVLASYGTGAVMAVPAHDERDFHFAKKYGLEVRQVVAPHLIDPNNPPVDGKENTKRVIVHAIVKHPTEEKFIALKNKKFPWKTPITGGVEDGEDAETAIRREILEETGYKNLKLIDRMPYVVRADYYAAHKNVNRQVISNVFLFKLENLEKNEIEASEQEKHDVVWEDWSKIDTLTPVVELGHIINWLKKGDHSYVGDGVLINSTNLFNEISVSATRPKIIDFLAKKGNSKGNTAKLTTKYKIRDWVFSRQRYWGEPIPMIHCEKCGAVPVPEKDLPVKLPEVKNYEPTGTGESPLAAIDKWVNVKCPKCKGAAKRETNTMPQWAGSSWYYLRFMDPKNSKALVDPAKEKYWNEVDVYVGGDHAVRHLIYARFWHKFLYDIGAVSTIEPFKRLEFLGFILAEDGRKMSKRYGNVINPDDIVHTYGADTLRVYEMFMSPFSQTTSWDTKAIMGSERFVERVFRIGERFAALSKKTDSPELLTALHQTIKKVSEDIESFSFNTAISSLMVLSRELEQATDFTPETFAAFLKLCAPFMPHVTEEIWASQKLAKKIGGVKNSIHTSPWPVFDPKLAQKNTVTIAIQINGKVRDTIDVAPSTDEKTLTALAMERPEVKRWLEGREVKKIVFVKGRILSFVV